MQEVKFKVGTSDQFAALEYKDPLTIYFLLDTHQIYKGSILFGSGLIEGLSQNSPVEFCGGSATEIM